MTDQNGQVPRLKVEGLPTPEPEDKAPPTPIRASSQPLPSQAETPKRQSKILPKLVVVGLACFLLLQMCQAIPIQQQRVTPVQPPNQPKEDQSAAQQQPLPQLPTVVSQRNVALVEAFKEADHLLKDESPCVDAKYLLDDANQQVEVDGTPVELTLLRKLNWWTAKAGSILEKRSQLGGDAKSREQRRALLGDGYAIVLALQAYYAGEEPTGCRAALAVLYENMTTLSRSINESRKYSAEQQLRNQGIARDLAQDRYERRQQVEAQPSPSSEKKTSGFPLP
jgi:hypothetical protein